MNGKTLRLNDFKLTYGQETTYINMYAAFKNKKSGNKYAIYSYENKNKLNYGTFHQRDKEAVELFLGEADARVVCGGITSRIVSAYLEKELMLENMVKSLGFSDAVVSVSVDSGNVNVFINSAELNYDTALSIYNMMKNETGIVAGNIIIMPVYAET